MRLRNVNTPIEAAVARNRRKRARASLEDCVRQTPGVLSCEFNENIVFSLDAAIREFRSISVTPGSRIWSTAGAEARSEWLDALAADAGIRGDSFLLNVTASQEWARLHYSPGIDGYLPWLPVPGANNAQLAGAVWVSGGFDDFFLLSSDGSRLLGILHDGENHYEAFLRTV